MQKKFIPVSNLIALLKCPDWTNGKVELELRATGSQLYCSRFVIKTARLKYDIRFVGVRFRSKWPVYSSLENWNSNHESSQNSSEQITNKSVKQTREFCVQNL